MSKYVMALDSGTTSNRCILFDKAGNMISVAQKEFTQHFPQPGWVEHDASEIWQGQLSVAREALSKAGATYEEASRTSERRWSCGTGPQAFLCAMR